MLDDIRDQATFKDDEELPDLKAPEPSKPAKKRRIHRSLDQVTGMTAPQRFILAVLLSVMVCLLGVVILVMTGKVVLPFM